MADSVDPATLRLALEPPSSGASGINKRPPPSSLSERLHRFWTERGDFSKFSLADLAEEGGKKHKGEGGGDASDESQTAIDWGLEGGEKKYLEEISQLLRQTDPKGKGKADGAENAIDTTPLTIEQFVQLKEEMMGRLQVAQQSLYSSQALVALLVAANRPRNINNNSATSGGDAATTNPTRNVSLAPSRGESPAAQSSASAPAAEKRLPPGSVAAVEAEFGLDPYSVALSSMERMQVTRKAPEGEMAEDSQAGVAITADDLEFANDAERDEYTRRLNISLAQKKRSVKSAISILRRGASRLSTLEGTAEEELEQSSHTNASAQRWKALGAAQRDGWGLTPGRPGQSIFTPAASSSRADEGEQDAWIGYGVPEARTVYRRTALAYFSHEAGESDTDRLVFASRRNKRLRVTCLMGGKVETVTRSRSGSDSARSTSTSALLHAAQEELVDCELFDEIVAESRALSSLGLVEGHRDKDTQVSLDLAQDVRVQFELVESDSVSEGISGGETTTQIYPSLVLSCARLSLVRKYQQRANAEREREKRVKEEEEAKNRRGAPAKKQQQPVEESGNGKKFQQQQKTAVSKSVEQSDSSRDAWKVAPFLMPMIGFLHYLSFTTQLETTLAQLTTNYTLQATQSITSYPLWLTTLMESDSTADEAIRDLSGSATVTSIDGKMVAQMHFSYPSHLNIVLPYRETVGGSVGVTLEGVLVSEVEEILSEELRRDGV